MIKLSEIIRTDCYIDCGTNEKLREVYPLIDVTESHTQSRYGIGMSETCAMIYFNKKQTCYKSHILPIHHISQIDLNA